MNAEETRLQLARDGREPWKKWGPYLSARAWGTVREDYSPDGTAWEYLPHDWARSKTYRWNEDGLGGICDDNQFLCFSLGLWNEKDAILKERPFGLTGNQGVHGEDVKEAYYYLDNTPTHAYQKFLYKYPQCAFPYQQLLDGNASRNKNQPEYELHDTGVWDENRYFDVFIEYAKADVEDVLICITVHNRGPETAPIHLLPTLWCRDVWSWGHPEYRPQIARVESATQTRVDVTHPLLKGNYSLFCDTTGQEPELLFCDNATNNQRLYNSDNTSPFPKDGINDYLVGSDKECVNPRGVGTKMAAHYTLQIAAGQSATIKLRLTNLEQSGGVHVGEPFGEAFDNIFATRKSEADEFYAAQLPPGASDDEKLVQRQAFAGLLWGKQFYHYDVRKWLMGDAGQPQPPASRWQGRNAHWTTLAAHDIISMPDTWEYPWFAAWDLAFHCIPLSLIDSDFAKSQLLLLGREWYMHPNGQLPAYEWSFGDVNPPVQAWAALRVFRIERKRTGAGDTDFLERVFQKLLLNFTWWVNRKDENGHNLFQGGFLGLDNIGIFDRSAPLPDGMILNQSDGTAWMATYCLNMLAIALELAVDNSVYEDVATKFLEHFFYIAHAMNGRETMNQGDASGAKFDLWDEEDGFYYDVLVRPNGNAEFLKTRSLVGLLPLLAVETLSSETLEKLPSFAERLNWFLQHRPDLTRNAASLQRQGQASRHLFAVVDETRLRRILEKMLDENEFLSPHGLRSVSQFHRDNPVHLNLDGHEFSLDYEPGASTTTLFGGNSNWRGPVWMPINYLLIEALQKFDYFYGDSFQIECPIGSGQQMNLWDVAGDLSRRLTGLFLRDSNGNRPIFGDVEKWQTDPNFRDYLWFFEYFNGDDGAGLGAMHQTGWTALVAKLIQQSGGARGE